MPSLEGSHWVNTDEAKQLRARLKQHADYAEPDDGYLGKVWAVGVMPSQDMRENVGEWFGLEMGPINRSRVEFCRDRLTGEFVLNRLTMPFENNNDQRGSVYIQGLQLDNSTTYVGYAKLSNNKVESTLNWNEDEADELSRHVMNGHDLPIFHNRSDGRYRMWLGMHVLGKTRSWQMLEKFQLRFSGEDSLNIIRDQSMPEDIRYRSDNITIMHTKSLTDRPDKPVLQRSLSFTEESGVSNVSRVTSLWTGYSGEKMTPSIRHKAVELKDLKYFRKLLNETLGEI